MTKRIEQLTPEQIARFPEWVEKWTRIGLCTDPADRPRAEAGIWKAYKIARLNPPERIVWCDSPLSQGLTRAIVLRLKNASVGASVRASVWDSVGASVGASVRDSVWDSVWDSVGDSVRASVRDSVGASVRDSVGASVWDSVWASVRDSVRDSVGASVWAYIGTFFVLPRESWNYTENVKTDEYPFQCLADLWGHGLVPSFDGNKWRLHGGKDAKILWEGELK